MTITARKNRWLTKGSIIYVFILLIIQINHVFSYHHVFSDRFSLCTCHLGVFIYLILYAYAAFSYASQISSYILRKLCLEKEGGDEGWEGIKADSKVMVQGTSVGYRVL